MNTAAFVMHGLRSGTIKKVPRTIRNVSFAFPIE